MTWVVYTPENMQPFLKAMSTGTKVLHAIGTAEAAQNAGEKRVTWVPQDNGVTVSESRTRLEGKEIIYRQGVGFDVTIHAANAGQGLAIHKAIIAWINLLVGPPEGSIERGNGYDLGDSDIFRGDLPGAASWALRFPVTLYDPIARREYPLSVAVTSELDVSTVDIDGTNEEPAIAWASPEPGP